MDKQLARDILRTGNRLYGEDLSHIEWAISQLVAILDHEYQSHESVTAFVEITRDQGGYGIAFIDTSELNVPG